MKAGSSGTAALAVALAPLCLLLGACSGTTYAIQPVDATALDDADWVIKHEPKPARAVASADSAAPSPPDAPAPDAAAAGP